MQRSKECIVTIEIKLDGEAGASEGYILEPMTTSDGYSSGDWLVSAIIFLRSLSSEIPIHILVSIHLKRLLL